MVNKKLKLRGKQKGFAIVTTLIISSVVLVLVGALFYKFSVNGKDIVQDSQRRQALAVAEEASSAYLGYVAALNNPTGKDDAARKALSREGAEAFLIPGSKNAQGVVVKAGTPNNSTFPGYNYAPQGQRAGYAKFKSVSGKGEFEIKTEALSGGGATAGYNPIKADIISYVPSKAAGSLVRDFNLKFTRTFPPIASTDPTAPPTATPTPAPTVAPTVAPTPAGKSGGKSGKSGKSGSKSSKSSKTGGKSKSGK